MENINYQLLLKKEHSLPNGKKLVQLDFNTAFQLVHKRCHNVSTDPHG